MGEINMKYSVLILVLIFSFVLILPASATDINDAVGNASDVTVDEVISENEKIDVELIANETYGFYGNNNELEVHAADSYGKNVDNGTVLFIDVFGKNYTANVKDGLAKTKVFVGQTGQFNITCNYIGTTEYNNATTTLLLTVPIINTTCKNIVASKYGDTVYFTGNMLADYRPYKDYGDFSDFEEVTEGIVTVYVDGERLGTCDVDVNGNYVYIWNTTRNLIGQTINFTGEFSNNKKHFNSSKFSKSFTFAPPSNTTILYNMTLLENNGKLISGIVTDENGNNVLGGTITINNKYQVIVDSNGEFKFYITDKTPQKAQYQIGVFDWGSKADIRANIPLMNAIEHTELTDKLIDLCTQGTPYIKFGNGNGKTVVVNVGTHGGELPSQVAGFKLINLLANYGDEINGTIYVIPTLFPESTANNTRIYNGTNLNTVADVNGTLSNYVVSLAVSLNASGLGDFHNTRHSDSDVGITCAMCSHNPTPESYSIAKFIVDETGYAIFDYAQAGVPYAGAIEDYANLLGIPSVTCESLSNHRAVEYGAPEMSFNEMRAFLRYFGFDVDKMVKIKPEDSSDLSLEFTSPYNYNPSSENISYETKIINNKNITVYYGEGQYFSVKVVTTDGKDVGAGAVVVFNINGKTISVKTDDNGVAKIKITEVPNVYPIITSHNNKNYTNKVTVKLNFKTCKLVNNKNINVYYTGGSYFSVKVVSANGKVVANGASVKFRINGKTTLVKTDKKGIAKIKITDVPKKYIMATSFNGKTYKNTVTVKRILTLKLVYVKKSAKSLVLTATLSKVNGKFLKSKLITFKFNGKTYKARTNSKGVAKVTISKYVLSKLKVGKKITYQATYVKDTVKKSVKVNK